MSLAKIATMAVSSTEDVRREDVFERLCLYKNPLAEIVLSEVDAAPYVPIPSLEIWSVQAGLDISDILSLVRNQGKKPVDFWQLLSLAATEGYKSFYGVSALGSVRECGLMNGERLISVPLLVIGMDLVSAREGENRIPLDDPKRDTMIENVRRSRSIGCEFRNRYNTKNMQIALVG